MHRKFILALTRSGKISYIFDALLIIEKHGTKKLFQMVIRYGRQEC